jgi:site-specific recombinase XerD
MRLLSAIENYVGLKRTLGAVFSVDARMLHSFSRALGDVSLEAITPEDCRQFCPGKGLPTRFWERKHESLRGFFRYLVARGYLVKSPLREPPPRVERAYHPYFYSHDELRRLLGATSQERSRHTLLEPETLRTSILLLYGAGLRAGEALRLRSCDVNLQDRVLSVWNTKFFKSRLDPVGASLAAALARYAQEHQPLRPPDGHLSRFFTT